MIDKSRMKALCGRIDCSLHAKYPVTEKCLNCYFCSKSETSSGGDITIGDKQHFLECNRELLLKECRKVMAEALED